MSIEEKNLSDLVLAPYIMKATALIGKARRVGGNQFRHAMATLAILLDYGYFSDPVLLKASVIHDLFEDVAEAREDDILTIDDDAREVVDLVKEVTKDKEVKKPDYLRHILEHGSTRAKILKVADRISNLTDMNSDIYPEDWIADYLDDTERFVIPMAKSVNWHMVTELTDLTNKRKELIVSHALTNS